MNRRALAMGLPLALLWSSGASAEDGFAVARFEPAERGSDWLVVDGLDFRSRPLPTVGATFDYAHKPLAVYDRAENERGALVRHQLLVHAGASYVFEERLRVGISVPLALYNDGESAFVGGRTLRPATKSALGDLRVAADARILGAYGGPFTLAAGARLWLPTGSAAQFTSDGSVRVAPQLMASGEAGILTWAARAALVLRPGVERYAGTSLESELLVAAGAGVRLGRWRLGPEVFATTSLDRAFGVNETPVDAVFSVQHRFASGLAISVAAGSGLTRGLGSPEFRALASLEWGAIVPAPRAPPPKDDDGTFVLTEPPLVIRPPKPPLAEVTESEIRITDQVRFATGSADLVESDAVLDEVRRLVADHPELLKVRVEGHTDDVGDPAFNDDLSARRAGAVVDWLAARGIDRARLEPKGYGSREPLDHEKTEEARAKNRRVVFTIVERAR